MTSTSTYGVTRLDRCTRNDRFYSALYGATGIERTENDVLSGTSDLFLVDRLQQLLSGRDSKGGAVGLTLNDAARRPLTAD